MKITKHFQKIAVLGLTAGAHSILDKSFGPDICLVSFAPEKGINKYKEGRNYPGENFVSKLSPYLHFGEISAPSIFSWVISKFGQISEIYNFWSSPD